MISSIHFELIFGRNGYLRKLQSFSIQKCNYNSLAHQERKLKTSFKHSPPTNPLLQRSYRLFLPQQYLLSRYLLQGIY